VKGSEGGCLESLLTLVIPEKSGKNSANARSSDSARIRRQTSVVADFCGSVQQGWIPIWEISRGRERNCENLQACTRPDASSACGFRLARERVLVRSVDGGILFEPIVADRDKWFSELDRFTEVPFMEDGRRQPAMREAV
jgi:hypothetical protein